MCVCVCGASFSHSICSKFSFISCTSSFFSLSLRFGVWHTFFRRLFRAEISTIFSFQNHFRGADAVAGAIAMLFSLFHKMNIYLLHTFGCGFKNNPKSSAIPFEPFSFFLLLPVLLHSFRNVPNKTRERF